MVPAPGYLELALGSEDNGSPSAKDYFHYCCYYYYYYYYYY